MRAVAGAVSIPVTLKIRSGWDRAHRNAPALARRAEDAGIAMIAVHGRTREDAFRGEAEYGTIALVKRTVSIPVAANGDVDSPEKALAALAEPGPEEVLAVILDHRRRHFDYYGDRRGMRTFRKHLAAYLKPLPGAGEALPAILREEDASLQMELAAELVLRRSGGG